MFMKNMTMHNGEVMYVTGYSPNVWSVRSGCACDPDVWNTREVPKWGDKVGILAGHDVTFSHRTEFTTLVNAGIVRFTHESEVVYGCITGINSAKFLVGSKDVPVSAKFIHRSIPYEAEDSGEFGNSIIWAGHETVNVEIYGKAKTPFIKYGEPIPSDWNPEDDIVCSNDFRHGCEYVKVSEIPDLTLRSGRCYLANLTRSVQFVTEDNGIRPHLMVMHGAGVFEGVEINGYGRTDKSKVLSLTNKVGRYGLHFHRGGETVISTVNNCTIKGSPGWAMSNHSSHVLCSNTIGCDSYGAGLVAEASNEMGTWDGCLAIDIHSDENPEPYLRQIANDRWHSGEGIVSNSDIVVSNCHSADVGTVLAWHSLGLKETIAGVTKRAEFQSTSTYVDNNGFERHTKSTQRRTTSVVDGITGHVFSNFGLWTRWRNFTNSEIPTVNNMILTNGQKKSIGISTEYDRGWIINNGVIDECEIGNSTNNMQDGTEVIFNNTVFNNMRIGHKNRNTSYNTLTINNGEINAVETGVEFTAVDHMNNKVIKINDCEINAPERVRLVYEESYSRYDGSVNEIFDDGVQIKFPWQ